jgi:hypothetical protein
MSSGKVAGRTFSDAVRVFHARNRVTGPSKPISRKTIPIFHFTRASTTMVMNAASVAMGNTVPATSIHRREKNSGGSGNLFTPVMPASPVGSCACPKTLSGVTEDCGATIRLRCWGRSFAWNSRWARAAWWLPPRRGLLQSPPICSS